MKASQQTAFEEDVDILENVEVENALVIHNDNVNSFDWVIETLVEVCKHTWEQAEQCAYIIHHKGKYAVKRGDFDILKPMKDQISERGIGVTIQ